ncbi:hypothetical protein SDC9_66272 [bioreactor metagenome]|uniref:Uncharacterized protein n=1 Tax=bioreactor metagenome TaxID=1076179 RepID=A0A644XUK0_9ZZZZ
MPQTADAGDGRLAFELGKIVLYPFKGKPLLALFFHLEHHLVVSVFQSGEFTQAKKILGLYTRMLFTLSVLPLAGWFCIPPRGLK